MTKLLLCAATLTFAANAHARCTCADPKTPNADAKPAPATAAPKPSLQEIQASAPAHKHRAPSSKESFVDYLWRKSDDAFHAGDYEKSVKLHRSIAVLEPGDIENYGVTSWLLWSMGRADEATAFLEKGLKANPQSSEMWDTAAQQFDMQKERTRARDAYARAIELLPSEMRQTSDAMMLRRRYAHALEHADELSRAVDEWRSLTNDFPDDVVNRNNLARAEAKLGPTVTPAKAAVLGGVLLSTVLAAKFTQRSLTQRRRGRREKI